MVDTSTAGASSCGVMSYGFAVTAPKLSDVQSQTSGAVVSMINTDEFGASRSASMLCLPFACNTCCCGSVLTAAGVGIGAGVGAG